MRTLNLIFDLLATQPNKFTKRHGGGIYGEIVFETMIDMNYCFTAVYDSSKWLNPKIKDLCANNGIMLCDLANESIDNIVERYDKPLIYSPVSSILYDKVKSITTIHGLRRIEMPNDWMQLYYKNDIRSLVSFFPRFLFPKYWRKLKEKEMKNFLLHKNLEFVTVSEHSRYSILSTFPEINPTAVQVFYSPSTTNENRSVLSYNNYDNKYFLLVSGNRWEKNNLRAMMALDELFSEQASLKEFSVIITGVDRLGFYKYKFKNPEKFICKGYVEDSILNSLYAGCYALIYPSLNEGFGYPPLEAMSYGKPIVVSAITSIPEVCGDAALYFNPLDYKEIKNRLLMITEDNLYKKLSQKAVERYNYVTKKQNDDLKRLIAWIVSKCELQ